MKRKRGRREENMGTKTQACLASICPGDGWVSGCGRLSPLEAWFSCGPLSFPTGLPTAGVTMKSLSVWRVIAPLLCSPSA